MEGALIALIVVVVIVGRLLFTGLFTWVLQWGLLAGFGIAVPFWPLFALTLVATWLLGFTRSYSSSSSK